MSTISAQTLLNGPGFNDEHMLEKAEREFTRIKNCRDVIAIYDHIMNFSITIASVSDWTFHLRLANNTTWANKSESNFTNWIRSQSPEVAAFIDISNECKHANRKHSNFVAEKILILPIWDASIYSKEQLVEYKTKGFEVITEGKDGKKPLLLIPTIKYDSKSEFLYDIAEVAIKWWKSCNLNEAVPMDKNLNLIS